MTFEEFKTTELEVLKKEYGVIKHIKISGQDFVYRFITRKDMKEIDAEVENTFGNEKLDVVEVPQEDGSMMRRSTVAQEALQGKIATTVEDKILDKVIVYPKDFKVDNIATTVRSVLIETILKEEAKIESEPEML